MNLSLPSAPIYLDLHPAAHRRTVHQQIFFNLHNKQFNPPPSPTYTVRPIKLLNRKTISALINLVEKVNVTAVKYKNKGQGTVHVITSDPPGPIHKTVPCKH